MLLATVKKVIATVTEPLKTAKDLGPVGEQTASDPRFVQVHDRSEYAIKCAVWCRNPNPYVCANEWIAGLIAAQCGIPVLDMAVVEHAVGLTVGWQRVPQGLFASLASDPRVLAANRDSDDLYMLAAFDALIRNVDRNVRNVMGRRRNRNSPDYELIAYDHDQSIIHPLVRPHGLWEVADLEDSRLWMRAEGLRATLTSRVRLMTAVDVVANECSDDDVAEIVHSTPAPWLADDERAPVIAFLTQPLFSLRLIVSKHVSNVLPHLE